MSINNRIFGSDLETTIKAKLRARQKLAERQYNLNDTINDKVYKDDTGRSYRYSDLVDNEFDGFAELSSRTPFARLWTAVQIQRHVEISRAKINSDGSSDLDGQQEKDHVFIEQDGYVIKKRILKHDRIVYEIGNHTLNIKGKQPNERIQGSSADFGIQASEILPNVFETNQNEFLKSPPGITSVKSTTEGALGAIKKTSVTFKVHNFHDYDKIYSKYFMRAGAQVFIDFGWDTSVLYDNRKMIFDEFSSGKDIEDLLYGSKGYVTNSKGDLETLIGHVSSYDAKINEDGSVDCSIEIVSKNSALIGYSYNDDDNLKNRIIHSLDYEVIQFAAQYFKNGDEFLQKDYNTSKSEQEDWDKVAEKFAASNLKSDSNFPKALNVITGVYWQTIDGDKPSNSRNIYISYGFFEDKILNSELGIGPSLKDIETGDNLAARYNSSNTFITWDKNLNFRQQYEEDATQLSFLYPEEWSSTSSGDSYNVSRNNITQREGDLSIIPIHSIDKMNKRIPLSELFISLNLIKESFQQSTSISQVLQKILSRINSDSFDIFNLKLSSNNYSSTELSVVDANHVNIGQNYEDSFFNDLFLFQPQSPSSIVKSYDISFSTPQNGLQNMIAIQSMSPGMKLFPFTAEIEQQLVMKGLESMDDKSDQIGLTYLPEIGSFVGERINKRMQQDSKLQTKFITNDKILGVDGAYNTLLDSIAKYTVKDASLLKTAVKKAKDPEQKVSDIKEKESSVQEYPDNATVVSSLSEYFGTLSKKEFYTQKMPTILPVELSLTIYGISSISPGDVFRVDYLPERFRNSVYFQIVSVEHDISNTTWSTSFTTVMRIHTPKKKKSLLSTPPSIFIDTKIFDEIHLDITEERKWVTNLQLDPSVANYRDIDWIFTFKAGPGSQDQIWGQGGVIGFPNISGRQRDLVKDHVENIDNLLNGTQPDKFYGSFSTATFGYGGYNFQGKTILQEGSKYVMLAYGEQVIILPSDTATTGLISKFNQMFGYFGTNE